MHVVFFSVIQEIFNYFHVFLAMVAIFNQFLAAILNQKLILILHICFLWISFHNLLQSDILHFKIVFEECLNVVVGIAYQVFLTLGKLIFAY